MVGFSLTRLPGQSWRDAAIAQGQKFGLGNEVATMFDDLISNGTREDWAAFDACSEWDVLDLVEESQE